MDRISTKITLVAVFAITFATIGWVAPAIYATHAPQDTYIEEHSFKTTDTTINSDHHTICFERTVHKKAVGEVFTELYLITENGERIQLDSTSQEQFFYPGRASILIEPDLPENIQIGTYRYERVYNMRLAQGRVERRFVFTSDKFTVSDNNIKTVKSSC